jgi:hypothetical protein
MELAIGVHPSHPLDDAASSFRISSSMMNSHRLDLKRWAVLELPSLQSLTNLRHGTGEAETRAWISE